MSGGAAIPLDGPFQLTQIDAGDLPFARPTPRRGGQWRLAWPTGTMIFGGWIKALDWLDDSVAKRKVSRDAVILAGPFSVPWILEFYLIAGEEAERNNHTGVFDAYAKSAAFLLATESEYKDRLSDPWVETRANRAT